MISLIHDAATAITVAIVLALLAAIRHTHTQAVSR